MAKIGLLGGCFNPVHNGHIRLGLEAHNALGLDRVELVPAPEPPHKPDAGLLDFAVRAELAELAVRGLSEMDVNRMEARRTGPSYTVETLEILSRERPEDSFTFIMGLGDFLALPSWRRGLDIPALADLGVAARPGDDPGRDHDTALDAVRDFVLTTFAGAGETRIPGGAKWELPGGRRITCFTQPQLEISSSMVRELWLAGRALRGLVPGAVEAWLVKNADAARAAWTKDRKD